MICPKCGGSNLDGSTFCVKCGSALNEPTPTEPVNPAPVEVQAATPEVQTAPAENANMAAQAVSAQAANTAPKPSSKKIDFKGYLNYSIGIIKAPFTTFQNEAESFNDSKSALIFAGVIAVAMMLCNFIVNVFIETKVSFKGIKYAFGFNSIDGDAIVELVLKQLLIYAAVIVAIAAVYYVVSLIFKKSASFTKLVAISATSMIPFTVGAILGLNILKVLWVPLAIGVAVAGIIYSVLILVNLINDYIKFDKKDMAILFNLICLTIIVCGLGYAAYKIALNAATGAFGGFGF